LKELETVPVIHREQGSTTRTIFERALIEQSIVLKSQIEVGSREGVRAASIHGLGISYVGAHELQLHESITAVSIADLQQTSKSYLVYSKDLEAVPIIQSMIMCVHLHQRQAADH
jgi:DNA-binding transcriptional LysR family regulator